MHLLGLAMSVGVAIYAEAAARQLHTSVEDLRARTRAEFEKVLTLLGQTASRPTDRAGDHPL